MLRHYDPDAGEWFTMELSEGQFSTRGERWHVVISEPRSVLGVAWASEEIEWSEHVDDIVELCSATDGALYGACTYNTSVVEGAFGPQALHVQPGSCLLSLRGVEDVRRLLELRPKAAGYAEGCVMSCSEQPKPPSQRKARDWAWNLDHFLKSPGILSCIVSSGEGQVFIAARSSEGARKILERLQGNAPDDGG